MFTSRSFKYLTIISASALFAWSESFADPAVDTLTPPSVSSAANKYETHLNRLQQVKILMESQKKRYAGLILKYEDTIKKLRKDQLATKAVVTTLLSKYNDSEFVDPIPLIKKKAIIMGMEKKYNIKPEPMGELDLDDEDFTSPESGFAKGIKIDPEVLLTETNLMERGDAISAVIEEKIMQLETLKHEEFQKMKAHELLLIKNEKDIEKFSKMKPTNNPSSPAPTPSKVGSIVKSFEQLSQEKQAKETASLPSKDVSRSRIDELKKKFEVTN